MSLYKQALEISKELKPYIELEGSEIQDTCEVLLSLIRCIDYLGEEFYQALIIELKAQLDLFKTRTRIITKTEKIKRTWNELEWKGIDYD